MSRILNAKDVNYLALEGGGGKGVAYLGAIRALEDPKIGVLPVRPGGQIRGLSGASAGAITALFLALGWDANQLGNLLKRAQEFLGFFDKSPHCAAWRGVDEKNQPVVQTAVKGQDPTETMHRNKKDNALLSTGFLGLVARAIKAGFTPDGDDPIKPIVDTMYLDLPSYMYNLLYDHGVFPGFGVRKFFERWIAWTMITNFRPQAQRFGITSERHVAKLTFAVMHEITGVDLVVTGTNVTSRKPLNFSRALTPSFPVSEAVAISMNLPGVFKPVSLEGTSLGTAYQGFWVDGGLLDNLPLHAFDERSKRKTPGVDPDLLPLNPHVLALRLVDGYPPGAFGVGKGAPKKNWWDEFTTYLGSVAGTAMYSAEEGQIRTEAEREQCIELYTYELDTLDFAPPAAKVKIPQEAAENAVREYFFQKKK